MAETDVIRGTVKLDNFLSSKCFTGWEDFVKSLPGMLAVEIPASITNVTIGNQQPTDDQRDNLWIRKDSSGVFLGLYLYGQGTWQQVYPAPNELIFMYGDSRHIPPGYQLASDSTSITAAQLAILQKIWTVGGTSPTWYTTFHVLFIGF